MSAAEEKPDDRSERIRPSGPVAVAARTLAEAGVESARADAELLAAYVLGLPRGRLALSSGFDSDQLSRYERLVDRRRRREPLQYLLGGAAFRHLELAVGVGVFVPRPETELLAGWGVERARAAPADRPVVVDLCAGSGAIALSVAHEVPSARVAAVERAAPALEWLRRNAVARAAAGDPPIEVLDGDVTAPDLLPDLVGRVDVLLCNPPYVPERTPVPPEVADFDPAEAVFGGADGLAVIRPVVRRAADLLRPGGVVGIEHDDSHAETVRALLRDDGRYRDVVDHLDLAGRARFVTGRRR